MKRTKIARIALLISGGIVLLMGCGRSDEEMMRIMIDADAGDPQAQMELADCYATGDGVETSYEIALEWYQKAERGFLLAAMQGDEQGYWTLIEMYKTGHGVPKSHENAVECYRKLAQHGNEKASDWLHNAGEHGDCVAQYELGKMYEEFWRKTKKSPMEVIKWYRLAAEGGHVNAMSRLGYIYYSGDVVKQNLEEAKRWALKYRENAHTEGTITEAYNMLEAIERELRKSR